MIKKFLFTSIIFIISIYFGNDIFAQESRIMSLSEFKSIIDGEKDSLTVVHIVESWATGTMKNFMNLYQKNKEVVEKSNAKFYFLLIPLFSKEKAQLERAYKAIEKLDETYFKNTTFKIIYSEEMFDNQKRGAKYFNYGDPTFIGKDYIQGSTPVTILSKNKQKYIFQMKLGSNKNANPIPLEKLFDYLK